MVKGKGNIGTFSLKEGDGLSFTAESAIEISNTEEFEVIVFDLR